MDGPPSASRDRESSAIVIEGMSLQTELYASPLPKWSGPRILFEQVYRPADPKTALRLGLDGLSSPEITT